MLMYYLFIFCQDLMANADTYWRRVPAFWPNHIMLASARCKMYTKTLINGLKLHMAQQIIVY